MKEMIKKAKEHLKVMDKEFLEDMEQTAMDMKANKVQLTDKRVEDLGKFAEFLKDTHELLCCMEETHGLKEEEWTAVGATDGKGHYAVKAKKDEYDDEDDGPRIRR